MKELLNCNKCGNRCEIYDKFRKVRVLQDKERRLYLDRQNITECAARRDIKKGIPVDLAISKVHFGQRIS